MSAFDTNGDGERALLARLRRKLRGAAPLATPFGDDMASITSDSPLLWSTDLLSDGVDFDTRKHPWRDIGRKALAVNLSDCAAMAARPVAALAAVCLNEATSQDDALEILDGIQTLGRDFSCPLVGGDTNSWRESLVIAVTVAALPGATGRPVLRGGARPGDRLCVSGTLGGSILGRHFTFTPRVREALNIVETVETHAMIDISDGFALDLWRVCEESRCGALVDAAAFDRLIHDDARRLSRQSGQTPREHALFDGEDFELLTAVAADVSDEALATVGLTSVGRFQAEREVTLIGPGARSEPLPPRGWEHLR